MKKLVLSSLMLISLVTFGQVPTTGLTAEYKFTNGRLDNAVGQGNLTQFGTSTVFENNRADGPNKALALNGDYLQGAGTAGYDLTVSFWIKTTTNDVTKRVIIDETERANEAESSTETGWYAYLKDGKVAVAGNFQWYHWNNTASGATGFTGYHYAESLTDISDGNWHHIAIAIDSYAGNFFNAQYQRTDRIIRNIYYIYIDGILEATHDETKNAGSAIGPAMRRFKDASFPLTIANTKNGNSANRFLESLDDFRYYNTVLNASQVGQLASEVACSGTSGVTAATQDITVQLDASGNASILADDIDNGTTAVCDQPFTLSIDKSTFTCTDLGFNVVTLTAVETATQETSTATATVTVTYVPEVITQNITVQLDESGNATIAPSEVNNGSPVDGICGAPLTFSLDKTTFTCSDIGSNVVSLTADDGNGNTGTATATVTIEDVTPPTVIAQDITIMVDDALGFVTISGADVDNGSTDNCDTGALIMSLSKSTFRCEDTGENVVTLTVEDLQGNSATADVTVTVTSAVNDETITATNTDMCPDGTSGSIISIGSSVVGFDYTLRNSADNTVVVGPIAGTGSAMDFNTGNLSATTTFNIVAEKPLATTIATQSALDFDGINDYVSIGNSNRGISTQITLAAWIKSTSTTAQYFMSKYNGINGILFFFDSDGKAHLDGRDGTGVYKGSGPSTTTVNDGEWHYVTGTINTSTGAWSIYVDGVLESANTQATGSTLASTAHFTIGSHTTLYFGGSIDQVTIWDTELEATAIASNFTACLAGNEANIVGHYIFEDGTGTVVTDHSASSLNGLMSNMDETDWIEIESPSCGEFDVCDFILSTEITIGDTIAPVAVAQNITAQIDVSTGEVTITADMIDNGSTDNCSITLTKSLSKSTFTCENVGEQMITLTVADESGNTSTAQSIVTITSPIADETVTTNSSEFCPDGSIGTISIGSSVVGIDYYLRNSQNNAIKDGPIAGTGGALDFSTGNISSTTTFNVFAKNQSIGENAALDFDGTNDFVDIPVNATFDYANGYTFEAWVKGSLPGAAHLPIFSVGSGSISDIEVYTQATTNSIVVVHDRGEATFGGYTYTVPPNNVWYHLAVTYDGTDIKVYYDGVEQSITNSSFAPAGALTKTAGLTMKMAKVAHTAFGAGGGHFLGQLDEVRVWNTVKSAAELLTNKDVCLEGTETDLEYYFKVDDNTGTTVTDEVNGTSGTMTNMDASTDWVTSEADIFCGSLCEFQMTTEITLGDLTNPIAIAQDLTVQLDASGNAAITAADVDNGSSDNCSTTLNFNLDKADFTCADLGSNTVTLIVTDDAGNEATSSATITVEETEGPTVITQNISAQLDESGNVSISPTDVDNGSSDNCTDVGSLVLSLDQTDFTCANLGENTVTLIVTDANGNTSSATALVTIEDVIAPTAIAQNIVAQLDANGSVSVIAQEVNNESADQCSTSLSFSLDQSTFTCSDLGVNNVILTVTDESGNQSTSEAIVTIVDLIEPTIVSQNVTARLDVIGNVSVDPSSINTASYDNCSLNLAFALSQTDFDCSNIGPNTVVFSVTDESGNTSSQDVIITVEENGPIVITQDITVELNANGIATIAPTNIDDGSSDDCTASGDLEMSLDVIDFSCEDIGAPNQVTLSVTDLAGNVSSGTAFVTVVDLIAPTVVTQDISLVLDESGNATIASADIDNGSTDNCTLYGDLVMNLDVSSFDINDLGPNTVTLTVTDASGNLATATAIVSVSDKEAQEVTFTGVEDKIYGDEDFSISASVDSSLPITFSVLSGGLSVASSTATSAIFTIVGAGSARIGVTNDGDDTYAPLQETITINVAKANQSLTVEAISNKSVVAQPFNVYASINTNLTLDYSVSGPATITGDVITLDGTVGTVSVTVSQPGTENYNLISETISFDVVEQQSQTITFTDIPDVMYGVADQTLSAASTSGLTVDFTLISGPATLSGNTLTITGVGIVTVEAAQAGDDDFLEASVQQTFEVSRANLIITADNQSIIYGDPIPTLTYSYSGFVNGEDASVLIAEPTISTTAGASSEAGNYVIDLEGGEAINYNMSLIDAMLAINKANQIITIESIPDKAPTDQNFDVMASVDSGLDLIYEVSGPATISGTTITLDGLEGEVMVIVSQEGDVNHNEASASITFNVTVVLGLNHGLQEVIKVYPNPVIEHIFIASEELVNLRFYTLNGQLLKELHNVKGKIDVSDLKIGTYLLEVVNANEHLIVRINKAN